MQTLGLAGLEQRAFDLRKAIGRWAERITDTVTERDDSLIPIGADDMDAREAIKAAYAGDIGRMEDAKAEAAHELAQCEAAIEKARTATDHERRAADKERVTALLVRHAKARIDIQGYADRLKGAIGELHAAEKELAEYAVMQRAPNALLAGGLRYRLESIGWPLRDWLKIPAASFSAPNPNQNVTVPFEERCRRMLVELEFIDEQGKPVI